MIVVAPRHTRGHHGAQADRASAERRKAAARTDLQCVEHGPCAALNPTAEGTQHLQRRRIRYLDRVPLVGEGKGPKRRLPEEVVMHRSARSMGCRTPILTGASEIQRVEVVTVSQVPRRQGLQ